MEIIHPSMPNIHPSSMPNYMVYGTWFFCKTCLIITIGEPVFGIQEIVYITISCDVRDALDAKHRFTSACLLLVTGVCVCVSDCIF